MADVTPVITPVVARGGTILGYIVRNEEGSYFVQRKTIRPGAVADYGVNFLHMIRDKIDRNLGRDGDPLALEHLMSRARGGRR